jgi:acetoin utilization deacetylase AcuC-like enzyme
MHAHIHTHIFTNTHTHTQAQGSHRRRAGSSAHQENVQGKNFIHTYTHTHIHTHKHRVATEDELAAVHTQEHVKSILAGTPPHDGDTYFDPRNSPVAALVAAGSVVQMTEDVCSGRARNGFCVVRPPGHHATKAFSMGFCIFNNVAVAAKKARESLGAKKVLIFDWDVHHGNGVQDIFYEDPDVLYISVHRGGVEQSFFYPLTGTADKIGRGPGEGFTVNIPLENVVGYTSDATYDLIMRWLVTPIAQAFKPDLVMVSAGFDAAAGIYYTYTCAYVYNIYTYAYGWSRRLRRPSSQIWSWCRRALMLLQV